MEFEKYEVRLLKKEDTKPYFQLIENNRPRLENFVAGIVSKTKSCKDTEVFVDEIVLQTQNKTYIPYILVNTDDNAIVGFFDVKNIDWNIPKAEIGYFIDKKHTGKGLATKVLDKIVTHFFCDLKFSKLLLRIHPDNVASAKVAENCGFIQEGIIRNDYKKSNGEVVDLIYYGKTNKTDYTRTT